jgi:parallel beta-helix repeat protein
MNSRAIIVLAGTVFGILAALLLASPLAFSQPCTVIVTNEVTLVEALDGDGTADILPGQTLCIGANINLADADGSGVVDITVAFSVSPTSEAQRITIRGEPEIDPATGLPARTLTVTTTALANALFDLDPSADFVTIKSLNLNPGGSIAAPRAIRTNAGTFAFRAENLRLLDNGDQDWSTAAFALAGDNAVILNNRVEDQDGGTAVCILLQGTADNATIDGNRCANDTTDRAQYGIVVDVGSGSTARHVIQGNTIIGYDDQGIRIMTAGAPPRHLIQNNTILGDNAMDIGIYTDGGADGDAAAPGPIIGPGNSVFDITTGAVQLNGNFNVVRDNASSFGGPGGAPPGNPLNAAYGIQVVGTDAVISNNSLYLADTTVGIEVTATAARTTISGNRITKDEGDGIRVASGAVEANIASNTIRAKDGNGDLAFDEDGIEVASSANIIRDNDIDLDNPDVAGDQRTGDHGINVTGNDNQILGNHVQRVGGDGVNITGTRNRVDSGSACLIENNAGHGVAISSSGNNFVFNCTIRNNLGDGVNVATADNLIQGNTITGNAGDGVQLNGNNNVVGVGGPNPAATQANTITGNGESGVEVNNGDENLIKGNTISGNALNQVLLTGGATKNTVKENTITAASDGIVVNDEGDDNNTIEKNTISGDAGSTGILINDFDGNNNGPDGILVKDNTLTGPGAAVAGTGIRNIGGGEPANRNKFTGNKIKNWSIGMRWDGTYVAHAYNCNVFQDNATGMRVTGTGTGNELNFQDVVAFDPAATQGNDFINNTTAHIDHQGGATVDGQNNFFFGAFAGTLPADSLVVFGPGDGSAFGFVVGGGATALQLKRTGTSCSGFTPPGGGGGGGGGGGSAPVLGDVNLNDGFDQGRSRIPVQCAAQPACEPLADRPH